MPTYTVLRIPPLVDQLRHGHNLHGHGYANEAFYKLTKCTIPSAQQQYPQNTIKNAVENLPICYCLLLSGVQRNVQHSKILKIVKAKLFRDY